uniref:Solute carrier family 15 member 5 n=1 Tax=Cyanoderma ruficeps TaxID=181631 RepID=A0A8C3RCE0_9PASS
MRTVTGALRNCSSRVWNSKRESYQSANDSGGAEKCIPVTAAGLLENKNQTSVPDAGRRDTQEKGFLNPMADKEQRPGRSDHAGKLVPQAEKKLHEAVCMLLVELCERFTFFGIVCNMILFCTAKLGYRSHQAAMVNMCFVGTSTLTPVLVGWLAEYLVGRIKLVCICMFLHFLGTALLPVVSFPFEDVYVDRRHVLLTLPKREQKIVFYFALLTASLGIGGIRAIVCPLSAYSLEDCGPKELLSFFNWFHWLVNLNSAVVFVSISYIQQSVARNLGFLIPFVSGLMAMITIHMVRGEMIYKPKADSSLLTTFGVIFSALKTCCVRHRYLSTAVASWLDHAKENHGGHYSETQVEGTKSLTRLFPLFTFQILYRTCIMQIPSGYYLQTMNSNLHFSGFVLPVAAMNVISIVPLLILVPILECVNSWLFSSKNTAHSPTIYIGSGGILCNPVQMSATYSTSIVGHLSAALSVMVAGFSEMHRKHFPQVEQTLSQEVLLVSSMSCFHLAPQYILLGVAEALVTPSCSWFPHLLHEGKLERFFFFLASLMMVNTLGFWTIAHRYNNLHEDCTDEFRGNLPGEKLLKHEKAIKCYNAVLESSPILSPVENT